MAYTVVTLAQLRVFLQERWEEDPFWTDDDADQGINDALKLFSVYTDFWWTSGTATQPANDNFVHAPSPMHTGARVILNGYALEPTTLSDLDYGIDAWQEARGTPVVWAPIDWETFVVYPCSATTISLTIEGVRNTPTLTTGTDPVLLGEDEQSAILDYALHAAAFKRGAAFLEATQPHFERFMRACTLRNAQLAESIPFRGAAQRGQRLTRVANAVEDAQS